MDESNGHDYPLGAFIGMEIERPEPGRALARVTAGEDHLNPHGVVHGGIVFSMIDTSMGGAVKSLLAVGLQCATVECHVRYLRSVAVGDEIVCESTVAKPGSRIFHVESRVTVGGRLVATGTSTYAVTGG